MQTRRALEHDLRKAVMAPERLELEITESGSSS